MRLMGRVTWSLLVALALSSCNTSEALTPPGDIGAARKPSSPVTQADTEQMAGVTAGAPPTVASGTQGRRAFGPQNSLETQAEALEAGGASPASSGPPPASASAGEPATQQSASLPAGESSGTIRFLPVIGAPVQAVTPLSRQLGAEARAHGLTIRPSSDAASEHILKGYFSAFADEGKVTVVYVWDVLDSTGTRLHRMQGQEKVPAKGEDPWAAVPASTMADIAAKTIQDYLAWRRAYTG